MFLLVLIFFMDFWGRYSGPSAPHIMQIIGARALAGDLESIKQFVAYEDQSLIPECMRAQPPAKGRCATYLPVGERASNYQFSLDSQSPLDWTRVYKIKFFFDHRSSLQTDVVLQRYGWRWRIRLKPEP
ncbi:MAG: hypothetical protein N2690_01900 [Rhodocyclaceae bacterium]|nr:hypothetical protein [Rhodocyclaceae bacterium]